MDQIILQDSKLCIMTERSRLRETGRDDCTTNDFLSFPEGDLHTHTFVCGHSDVLYSQWSMSIIFHRRRFFSTYYRTVLLLHHFATPQGHACQKTLKNSLTDFPKTHHSL